MMKALALLSGGLDSTLAINIIRGQGIDIEAVNFFTPFCLCSKKNGCGHQAKKVTDSLGIKLKIFSLTDEYFKMLENPQHGYGKNLNPCIDCRILMHKKAKEYMKETGASFIVTGEVLGQRPMSQHIRALKTIETESGLEGLILRPLSAKLLPESIPEKKGWVRREKLLEISGRSRRTQMDLAKDYGIYDYPCSAGGCLLTDSGFSRRMKDLMKNGKVSLRDIELLKLGRHFRLTKQVKLIVGRNKDENEKLLRLSDRGDIYFWPKEAAGPTAISQGDLDENTTSIAAQIVARYCDNLDGKTVKIVIEDKYASKINYADVWAIDETQLEKYRI